MFLPLSTDMSIRSLYSVTSVLGGIHVTTLSTNMFIRSPYSLTYVLLGIHTCIPEHGNVQLEYSFGGLRA